MGKGRDLYRGYPTIRLDWDRFYKAFPERYDRFALSTVGAVEEIHRLFGLTGTHVLDIASGTGKSAFAIARYAHEVIGVEPWIEMRGFAIEKQRQLGIDNVTFLDGTGDRLERFATGEFDRVISTFGAPFPWDTSVGHGRDRGGLPPSDQARRVRRLRRRDAKVDGR